MKDVEVLIFEDVSATVELYLILLKIIFLGDEYKPEGDESSDESVSSGVDENEIEDAVESDEVEEIEVSNSS